VFVQAFQQLTVAQLSVARFLWVVFQESAVALELQFVQVLVLV